MMYDKNKIFYGMNDKIFFSVNMKITLYKSKKKSKINGCQVNKKYKLFFRAQCFLFVDSPHPTSFLQSSTIPSNQKSGIDWYCESLRYHRGTTGEQTFWKQIL